jgi:ADP-ribose 1''-phosphate phosphatase
LEATGDAVRGLLTVLREVEGVAGVRMCRINEGLFRVPWASTRRVLEGVVLGEEDVVTVIDVVSREE